MRLLLLLILMAATVASSMVFFARLDAGYVLLAWAGYSLEMTAWVFLATLAAALFLLWSIGLLLRYSFGLKFRVGRWFGRRGMSQRHNMTAHGLAAFEEGHWIRARKLLSKVADQSDNALVFYLMCARASHALGDQENVSAYLKSASGVAPNASMAINLTQAQMQLSDGALEACLATLIRAHAINEAHPAVLKMLAEVYEGLNDWAKLNKLLPQLQAERVLSKQDFEALQFRCVQQLLLRVSKDGLDALNTHWKKQLSVLRQRQDVIAVYGECLIRLQAHEKAETVLRQSLAKQANDDLVQLYGQLNDTAPEQRFSFISSLLNKGQPSAALLLCAAKLARLNKLPGQARELLERTYQQAPSNAVRLELVDFYLSAGDSSAKAVALLGEMRQLPEF